MDAALFHEPRRRMIQLHDGEMAALDFGDPGRPIDIVFAHANGFNALTYRSILGPLSLSLRVLAVDQRGHGASRLPAEPQGRRSWLDLRDDLAALLDAIGGDRPVVLAGHSMGATASLLAGTVRPGRVKGLVLFDPVILPRAATWAAKAPWLFARRAQSSPMVQGALRRRPVFDSTRAAFDAYRGRGAFKTWPEVMLADYVAGGFRDRTDGKVELNCTPAWEASNYAAQGHDPWAALRRARHRVRILRAEHHSVCALMTGDGLLRRNRRLRLATVVGTGHFMPMERPDVAREALLDAADA